jgi:hypothetical protein
MVLRVLTLIGLLQMEFDMRLEAFMFEPLAGSPQFALR